MKSHMTSYVTLIALLLLQSILQTEAVFSQTLGPNIRIHPNASDQQFETCITTQPSDPNTLFAIDIAASMVSPVLSAGWYHTTDGGITWTGRDTLPTHSNFGLVMVDQAVGMDSEGNLYAAGLYGALPPTALDVFVSRSTDHGVVWPCWNDNRTGVHQAYTSRIDFPTSVREVLSEYPTAFALAQNYPQPLQSNNSNQLSVASGQLCEAVRH